MCDDEFEHTLPVANLEGWYGKLLPYEKDRARIMMASILAKSRSTKFNIGIEHRIPGFLFTTENMTFDSARDALCYLYRTYILNNNNMLYGDDTPENIDYSRCDLPYVHYAQSFDLLDNRAVFDVDATEDPCPEVADIQKDSGMYLTENSYRDGIRALEAIIPHIKFHFV